MGYLLVTLLFCPDTIIAQALVKKSENLNVEKSDTKSTLSFITIDNLLPFCSLKNGKPVGFAVEILNEIKRRLGRTDTLEFDEWKSAYQRGLSEPWTVLIPPSRTPERETLFKWVGPLVPEKLVLFARKDSNLLINSLADAKNVSGIATVAGYASEKLLKQKGFNNLVSQRSSIQAPDALKFGRVDLWLNSNITMRQTALDANVDPSLFKPVLIVKGILHIWLSRNLFPMKSLTSGNPHLMK